MQKNVENGLSLTIHNIVLDDLHMVVPVRSGVFVPEPDHVTQLVYHYAELIAVLADRDRLRPSAALADE